MHRHGYKGRKFKRGTDQRRALIKGLASSLAVHESIETTLPKAKELVPYFEKLITKAKKGDLHNRRQVIAKMANIDSAHRLVDQIAPQLGARSSGYLRIEKTSARLGDNTQMAKVSFVDNLKKPVEIEVAKPKAEVKKPSVRQKAAKTAKAAKSAPKAAKKEAK